MPILPPRPLSAGLLAAGLLLKASSALATPPLPRLEDPQLQGFLNTLQAEYEQFLANPGNHFKRPAEAKAWPCSLTPAQLNRLAETTNSDEDPVLRRALILNARSWRTDPVKLTYSNQSFLPVQATCKAGKLEGVVDFWVEYNMANSVPTLSINSHMLAHIRFTARGGEPAGQVLRSLVVLDSNTSYADPATSAMMARQKRMQTTSASFSARWATTPPLPQPAQVSISHVTVDGKVTSTVTTQRPFGDSRVEETTYRAGQRTYSTLYKDGKLHGEQITYPQMMGTFAIPRSSTCWEDGEKILTTSCTVD